MLKKKTIISLVLAAIILGSIIQPFEIANAQYYREGTGSYTVVLPPGAKVPQAEIYKTSNLQGAVIYHYNNHFCFFIHYLCIRKTEFFLQIEQGENLAPDIYKPFYIRRGVRHFKYFLRPNNFHYMGYIDAEIFVV